MTCIVAITDGKRIVMGADSAGSNTETKEIYTSSNPKLWSTGEYLVGICGSYRAGQLARWEMSWPEPPADPGADLEGFMVREVVANLRQTLKDAGFAADEKDPTKVPQFLVGLRGRLFTITGDLSAFSLDTPWMAIGSGRHTAYGALQILAGLEIGLEDKVLRTLAAAQEQTCNVRAPFHLLSAGAG